MSTTVSWDYSSLAAHYDNRADYGSEALDEAIALAGLRSGDAVADIGAGTGKLAVPLARAGLVVHAVEPNAAMRSYGIRNTAEMPVSWSEGTGEATGLDDHCVRAVFFGSSFNVVDRTRALTECRRIVALAGWFGCLWNHRVLSDPTQTRIEDAIRDRIPDYRYGSRREDPTPDLTASGLFDSIHPICHRFVVPMRRSDIINAWRSHATLQRQAGDRFTEVIDAIAAVLPDGERIDVPYETRMWMARFAA